MGKYDPLRDHLATRPPDVRVVAMSFSQVEDLVGPLPQSARSRPAWWETTVGTRAATRPAHPNSWHVQSADLTAQRVVFARTVTPASPPGTNATPSPAPTAGPETAASPERRAWLHKVLSKRVIGELAVVAVTGTAAGVSGLVGVTHLPWPALALLSVSVAVPAFTITQAITSRDTANVSLHWWFATTIIVLVAIAGAFTYHKLWDPSTLGKRTYQFVVNGTELSVIPLFGEAGGPQQLLATGYAGQNGLVGGQSYSFDCWVIGRDGGEWLRYERFGQSWWAPRKDLHPPFGESEPPIPHC